MGLTGKDLIDHTISLFSGTHLTLPTVVLNLGESASLGTGMWISTLLAVDRRLNWLLACKEAPGRGSGGCREGSLATPHPGTYQGDTVPAWQWVPTFYP